MSPSLHTASLSDGGGQVEQVERELVSLLQQLCVSLVRDPSVLELFFHSTQDQGAANFLLFSLLIPYTHRYTHAHTHTHITRTHTYIHTHKQTHVHTSLFLIIA